MVSYNDWQTIWSYIHVEITVHDKRDACQIVGSRKANKVHIPFHQVRSSLQQPSNPNQSSQTLLAKAIQGIIMKSSNS